MALAEHIGISDSLLKPWRAFLDEFVRSFQIQTALSMPERGTQGLPWHLQFMLLPVLTTFLKLDMCGFCIFLHHLLLSTLGIAVGLWENVFLEHLSFIQGNPANLGVNFAV